MGVKPEYLDSLITKSEHKKLNPHEPENKNGRRKINNT